MIRDSGWWQSWWQARPAGGQEGAHLQVHNRRLEHAGPLTLLLVRLLDFTQLVCEANQLALNTPPCTQIDTHICIYVAV